MKKKYFGTDGIRGKVGVAPISADWVLKLGWAAGTVFTNNNEDIVYNESARPKVLIGKDTRISGYMFESALESGFAASGVDINLLGPMPTPAIAYLTRTLQAAAGIVISASHNPYHDNGIKFISADGYKLSDEVELEIESLIDQEIKTVEAVKIGRAKRVVDAEGRYIEFCKSTLPINSNLKGLRIALDCANGATYNIAPKVFQELGATVEAINVEPNGLNINKDCGSTNPNILSETLINIDADVGIALDGDGDRCIMIDHTGSVVDGDEILFIIAKWYKENNLLKGGVVGTQMSNLGLELALKDLDIPFARAKVGDRYVLSELIQNNWNLGGESSGHIICLDSNTTGDGIVSSLQVLGIMKATGKSLYELKQEMTKLPQVLINVPTNSPKEFMDNIELKQAVLQAEEKLKNSGRILLRPSGTEPLIRVMVEGENIIQIKQVANDLADAVKKLTVSEVISS